VSYGGIFENANHCSSKFYLLILTEESVIFIFLSRWAQPFSVSRLIVSQRATQQQSDYRYVCANLRKLYLRKAESIQRSSCLLRKVGGEILLIEWAGLKETNPFVSGIGSVKRHLSKPDLLDLRPTALLMLSNIPFQVSVSSAESALHSRDSSSMPIPTEERDFGRLSSRPSG
jgi:hypothetical protein